MSQLENRKYVSFSHTFSDPWSGENAEEAQDVTLSFRFAKPTKLQIQRLQDKAAKNAGQASRNLVLDCVHPDDKQALTDAMEEYPGIATSFATAIIKGVGISAELGKLAPPPDAFGQGDALILHWLHCEPSEDITEWRAQVGRAAWMEERYFTTLARIIHGNRRGSSARKK